MQEAHRSLEFRIYTLKGGEGLSFKAGGFQFLLQLLGLRIEANIVKIVPGTHIEGPLIHADTRAKPKQPNNMLCEAFLISSTGSAHSLSQTQQGTGSSGFWLQPTGLKGLFRI